MGKIPRIKVSELGIPSNKFTTKTMCPTCAYKTQPSPEEDEMTILYWREHPRPHPCHERQNGWACKGALDSFKRLGLAIGKAQ